MQHLMPFKSESRLFGPSISTGFIFLSTAVFATHAAWAAVQAGPQNPYVTNQSQSPATTWYATNISNDIDSSLGYYDLNLAGGYNQDHVIYLNLTTDQATNNSQGVFEISVALGPSGGGASKFWVPLYSAFQTGQAEQLCNGTLTSNCAGNYTFSGNTPVAGYNFAAFAQTGGTTVGIRLSQICDVVNRGGPGAASAIPGVTTPFACASGLPDMGDLTPRTSVGGASETLSFPLTVYYHSLSVVNAPAFELPSSAETSAAASLNIGIEEGPPAMSGGCPSLTNSFFPGDGELIFNADTINTFTIGGSNAGIQNYYVVANRSGEPSSTSPKSNDISALIAATGSSLAVQGFINTTGGDNIYHLNFGIRDFAGVQAFLNPSCSLYPVATSAIQGYLKKNQCFIATAAFRVEDNPVLHLLRGFRDQVLLKQYLGQSFVHWYYAWSPAAAEWLVDRPALRIPVLGLLIPVQILAWLLMHPWVLATLWMGIAMVWIAQRERLS